jgi:transketolase
MREAFCRTISELARNDQRILLLTGDLGFMALEPFAAEFPGRFFNAGVAEQNMVGLATGLAEAGFIPFVYSIVTFATLRPYEFIRNGPIHHHLPVRIVGIGGGLEYCRQGISHQGLEDIGVMRLQPGLTVIAPADHEQAHTAFLSTWDLPGPVYYRLGKDKNAPVQGLNGRFTTGRAQVIRQGSDLLIVALGGIAGEAAAAADILAARGINCTVAVVASVSPPPVEDLSAMLKRFKIALTVEVHYTVGGLGSLVAEVIADGGLTCRLVRCGIREKSNGTIGNKEYLYRLYALSPEAIAETALREMEK